MKKVAVLGTLSKSTRIRSGISEMRFCNRKYLISRTSGKSLSRRMWVADCHKRQPFPSLHQPRGSLFTSSVFCTSANDDSDSDTVGASGRQSDVSDEESDLEEDSVSMRNYLFPYSQDPFIQNLTECASVQNVFDVVVENENDLKYYHACQAIVILWDLFKIYKKVNLEADNERFNFDPLYFNELIGKYIKKVQSHEVFQKILSCLVDNVSELSPDEATCMFLYLPKLGVSRNDPVMPKLLCHIENLLDKFGNNFPLSALSRHTIALFGNPYLNYIFSVQKSLPIIYNYIDTSVGEKDILQLTICLRNVRVLIDSATFEAFRSKIEGLIEEGFFDRVKPTLVVKVASFFNYPYWSEHCSDLSKKLLTFMKGKTSNLTCREITRIHRILQNQLEPAFLLPDINERVNVLLTESYEHSLSFFENAKLLSFRGAFSLQKDRKPIEKIVLHFLRVKLERSSISALHQLLCSTRPSNEEIYKIFWSKVLDYMKENPSEQRGFHLLRNANRYMIFFDKLGYPYRHFEFENHIIKCILEEFENGAICSIPKQYAHMVAFLIAFNDRQDREFFNKLTSMINKLDEMSPQLLEGHCSYLCKGVRFSLKHYMKPQMYDVFVKLDSILNSCLERHTLQDNKTLARTNMLMRSYVMRKGPLSTNIFFNLVKRYEYTNGLVNSRIVRDTIHNLTSCNCLIPPVIDVLTNYVVSNKDYLLGETAELLLYSCFHLGYSPKSENEFLEAASDIIVKESYRMGGLSILQSSLALCFFRKLPADLVNLVFGIDFLERLDDEIANCFAKASYPPRVRSFLMQLNRAVCLDYPEYDVPWFHKKYCEEVAASVPVQSSRFFTDVKDTLNDVLGNKDLFKSDHYSPYGYHVDFLVVLDEKHQPVSWKFQTDQNIKRYAVMLLREDAFSNNVKRLRGYYQMKKRHLEVLGYKIVPIVQTHWNSMFMSEPGMKSEFVMDSIFNENSVKIPMTLT